METAAGLCMGVFFLVRGIPAYPQQFFQQPVAPDFAGNPLDGMGIGDGVAAGGGKGPVLIHSVVPARKCPPVGVVLRGIMTLIKNGDPGGIFGMFFPGKAVIDGISGHGQYDYGDQKSCGQSGNEAHMYSSVLQRASSQRRSDHW